MKILNIMSAIALILLLFTGCENEDQVEKNSQPNLQFQKLRSQGLKISSGISGAGEFVYQDEDDGFEGCLDCPADEIGSGNGNCDCLFAIADPGPSIINDVTFFDSNNDYISNSFSVNNDSALYYFGDTLTNGVINRIYFAQRVFKDEKVYIVFDDGIDIVFAYKFNN